MVDESTHQPSGARPSDSLSLETSVELLRRARGETAPEWFAVDMDEATPNKQWVDTSGDIPPSGIWYYQITAYNHRCPAEGPR